MTITKNDEKLLWGRAAGLCSNPTCRDDLTELVSMGAYTIGEMAHIIARKETGARGIKGGGSNSYENLILLCPTCHTHVDKAPEGTYSVELLHKWKDDVEALRAAKLGIKISNDHYDLFEYAYNSFAFEQNILFIQKETWLFNKSYYNAMFQMLNRVNHYSKYVAECAENIEINEIIKDLYQLLRDFDGERSIISSMCNKSRILVDSISREFNSGEYRRVVSFARNLLSWLVAKAHDRDMYVYDNNLKDSLAHLLDGKSDDVFLNIISDQKIGASEQEKMLYDRAVYLIQNHTG